MSHFVQLAYNAVNAKLLTDNRDLKLLVSDLLSYEVEGADQTSAFRSGSWDGRSSFFQFKSGMFPAGFVDRVNKKLTADGYTVQVACKPLPEPLGYEVGSYDPFSWGYTERYKYQPDTVRELLKRGRLTARVATGGGKSLISLISYATIKRPTLFLTTRTALMHQMADYLVRAGLGVGYLGEGNWNPRKGFNVATVQTIAAKLKEDHPEYQNTIKLLSTFEFVIGEEAQDTGGNNYYDILNKCTNAHYRMAMTATPFMRDNEEANMRLEAAFGPTGIHISEKMLIDRSILANPVFKIINAPSPPMLRRGTSWPSCYVIGIVENQERNKAICYEATRAAKHKLPTLILVQRQSHGDILVEMLKQAGISSRFISGKDDQDARRKAMSDLKSGKLSVLVGSNVFETGVDIPALGMVIMAGGGKAEVGARQRIGRGLREKKGWNECFIVDFSDQGNKILSSHAQTRLNILTSTPGFAERILGKNEDFDYARMEALRAT